MQGADRCGRLQFVIHVLRLTDAMLRHLLCPLQVIESGDHKSLMDARGVYWQLTLRQECGVDGETLKSMDAEAREILEEAEEVMQAKEAIEEQIADEQHS
jgi:hypothetical protein